MPRYDTSVVATKLAIDVSVEADAAVTDSAIAPSARMPQWKFVVHIVLSIATSRVSVAVSVWHLCV